MRPHKVAAGPGTGVEAARGHTLINLVATRARDGDHAALLRWYNEHVNVLMGFPGLLGATLYRHTTDSLSTAPEYICLYEFPGHDDFLAFEKSDARELAGRISRSGWGRDGIQITKRTQYMRLGSSNANDSTSSEEGTLHCLQGLGLQAGPRNRWARWLASRLGKPQECAPQTSIAWHLAAGEDGAEAEALVVLKAPDGDLTGTMPFSTAWWEAGFEGNLMAQAPASARLLWSGVYRNLCQWKR